MSYLFYAIGPNDRMAAPAPLPPGYTCQIWRPSWTEVRPPRAPLYPYVAFWAMHHARVFANRDYAVLLIYFGDELVHQAAVTAADFRYPFMSAADLQIGNVLTEPRHRGRGLAVVSIRKIVDALRAEGRTFWYVTDMTNAASQRAVAKAGFHAVGVGTRASFGLPFFVRYRILGPAPAGNATQAHS